MLDELLIREKLKKKLSPRRYEHSIGVAYTAAAMAMVYDVNIKAAKYAGLYVHQRRDNEPLPHPVAEDSAPEQVAR